MGESEKPLIVVRDAKRDDAIAIWCVRTLAIRSIANQFYSPRDVETWANVPMSERFADAFDQLDAVVCEIRDSIVGWGFADFKLARIEAIFVEPSYFGNGVGRKIGEEFECRARSSGLESLELSSTLNAVPFYSRLGFQALGESLFEHPAGFTLPCVTMAKSLRYR